MTTRTLTVDQTMALRPCCSRERIAALWAGREALSPGEIAALPIPAADRLWALLRMAPREVWLPAIYAAAERARLTAANALRAAGHTSNDDAAVALSAATAAAARAAADAAYAADWALTIRAVVACLTA